MKSKNQYFSNLIEEELIGLSPIQTIMKMAEDRNIIEMGLKPEEVISFGGGWCNHKAPDSLRQAYLDIIKDESLFHKSGRYSPIKGEYNCRKQICNFEKQIFNIKNIYPDNIIIGHSSTQLFHDTIRVLNNSNDLIAFLDPTYANYENAVKCALKKANISYISALNPETWDFLSEPQDSIEELKELCSNGLRTLITPIPDNPTSQIVSYDFLKNCYQILEENNAFLVIDFAYKELYFGEMPDYFKWSPKDYPFLVTLHSNSKWLSSLGRRFGWAEANENIISSFEKINESSILSPDTLHSMATTRFLEKTLQNKTLKPYIDQTRNLYQKTANVLIKSIEKYLDCNYLTPQGGLYTCIPTPNKENPIDFVEKVLKKTGVLLIPGIGFGPSMEKGLRLSYGPLCYSHEKIKEGIEKVGKYLENF